MDNADKKIPAKEDRLIPRETYKRVKHMDRTEMSDYLSNVYMKGITTGYNAGKRTPATNKEQAAEAKAPKRPHYQPITVWGRVHDTGRSIDGFRYMLSLWDYDKFEDFHMVGWLDKDEEAERALMTSMHDTDETYADMPMDEFEKLWKAGEYEAPGVYTVPLVNVTIDRVVSGELKDKPKAAPEQEGQKDE